MDAKTRKEVNHAIIETRISLKESFRELLRAKIKQECNPNGLCRDCRLQNLVLFDLLGDFPWDM